MAIGLADYEFQLNDSGIRLNGSDLTLPYVDITKVSGLDSAPYRETIRDHEGQDGGFIDAEFEKGREIILEGTVFGASNNVEPYLDSIKSNFAPSATSKPFYFKSTGVSERVIFVKPRGVRFDWETARRLGMTNIQFLMYAEDPRIYDNSLTTQIIPYGGTATTGFGFNVGFNLSFGANVPPNGSYVTVGGNRPAPAILTITGPVDQPRIINDTNSKNLIFNTSLGGGETLTIDLAARTVLLNGNINRRNTLITSDWFLFQPGSTFIRFGGTNGTSMITTTDGFEGGGVTGWNLDPSATFVNSTAQARTGIRSGLLTSVGTPTQAFVRKSIQVVGGQSYTCSLYAYSTPGYASVAAAIDWFDSVGAYITTFSSSSSLAAATWANRTITGIAPANATSASYGPTLLSNPPNNTQLFIDDVAFTGPAYNPGSLTVKYRNAWR